LCDGIGFQKVRTYIQSGNVIFESTLSEARVEATLQDAVAIKMGKPVAVFVRTPAEMLAILAANPFPDREPARVAVMFLHNAPPPDLLSKAVAPGGELVQAGKREIYVYYPDGMGRSKLKLLVPATATTVRNLNTVTKLVRLASPPVIQ
jgi:uncharacterized protein (DUF1697 family)